MKLSIRYIPKCKNKPWLIKREYGKYSQHAHFNTKKEAKCCRHLIDTWQYPKNKKYKIAMKRILTEKEYKTLHNKI